MIGQTSQPIELYYWPTIPGRGELIRLILEYKRVPYIDVAREKGHQEILNFMSLEAPTYFPPRAPPFIKIGDTVLFQSTNIAFFLSKTYNFCPPNLEFVANQIALTIADYLDEVHNVHHPISGSLYYEEQKDEALKAAKCFLKTRLCKFLDYMEKVLRLNQESQGKFLVGADITYVDLFLFQAIVGTEYMFPNNWKTLVGKYALINGLKERVASRTELSDYLGSDRRKKENEHGIFRHYPELDVVEENK